MTAFAQQIREMIRHNVDWVVRYGGEEFLVVLPETDFEGGCRTAERLRRAVASMKLKEGKHGIKLTASFGVTGFDPETPDEKVSSEAMIALADKCLYRAKEEGRNRVCAERL